MRQSDCDTMFLVECLKFFLHGSILSADSLLRCWCPRTPFVTRTGAGRIKNNFAAALGLPAEFQDREQVSLHSVYLEWCYRQGIELQVANSVFPFLFLVAFFSLSCSS